MEGRREKVIWPPSLGGRPVGAEPMAELLSELESKRERENAGAERHRRRRDELNEKTRHWVDRRDELNARVRELVEEAANHRVRRDELNAEVKKVKEERDAGNRSVNELYDKVNELKRRNTPRGSVPIGRLRREIKALEFKQMTTVLAVDKERELIEELGRLQAEVKRLERVLEQNEEVKAAVAELREAKERAEATHRHVGELADAAQVEHDAMMRLYEESDEVRKQADAAQEEFIKTKMLADEEHRKHIEHIREVHDYDKLIQGIRIRDRAARIGVTEVSPQEAAEQIYEKFKRGEKLSTEDLMTLQKSGYL